MSERRVQCEMEWGERGGQEAAPTRARCEVQRWEVLLVWMLSPCHRWGEPMVASTPTDLSSDTARWCVRSS
jgi:hypothetical protein